MNENGNAVQELFDFATFDAVFSSATNVRALIIDNASENVKKAQGRKKLNFNRRHLSNIEICVSNTFLLSMVSYSCCLKY